MILIQTGMLFVLTALSEIVGCFLPYLWLRKGGAVWLLFPAALSLAASGSSLSIPPPVDGFMLPMAAYMWRRPSSG